MPVQIGAPAHHFSDPTGLLSDCHRRIEMFLVSLESVAGIVDRPLTREAKMALGSALLYFREAAPKHTADEEESLFPRLREVQNPDIQSALATLDGLENDHRFAISLHADVERLGQRYISAEILSPSDIATFRDAIASLGRMYRQHIHVEDEIVFPVAARLLSKADLSSIAKEMAARRNVEMAPPEIR